MLFFMVSVRIALVPCAVVRIKADPNTRRAEYPCGNRDVVWRPLTKPPGTGRLVSGLFLLSSLLVYSRKQESRSDW